MPVEIRPVKSRRELDAFIKLPWLLYRDEPIWVAPLVMDLKKRLDQDKNPFSSTPRRSISSLTVSRTATADQSRSSDCHRQP